MHAADDKYCHESLEYRGHELERMLGRLDRLEFDHVFGSGFEFDFDNSFVGYWLPWEKKQPELELVREGKGLD